MLIGNKCADVSLPSALPVTDYITDAVTALTWRWDGDSGFDFDAAAMWTLAPVGQPPIRPTHSLDDARITDGDLVVLQAVSHTERYRPLTEDVVDAAAALNTDPVCGRRDVLGWLSWWAGVMMTGVGVGGVYGWSASTGTRWWWGPALVLFGLLGAGAALVLRKRGHTQLAWGLGAGGALSVVCGALIAVPLPEGASWLGAPNIAAVAAVSAVCVLATPGGPSRWRAGHALVLASAVIVFAAAVGIGYGWDRWVWPVVLLTGVLLIKNAARWVRRVARIALPLIPRPGEDIAPVQLDDPIASLNAAGSSPSGAQAWTDILASAPSSAAALTQRSMLIQQLLAGFVGAGCGAVCVAALMLLQRGHFLAHTIILCAILVIVLLFRARLFADRRCVWLILTGAAIIVAGVAAKMLWWWPSTAPLVLGVTAAVTVVVLVAALSTPYLSGGDGPSRRDEIVERVLEVCDIAAVAAIPVLLAWIAGIYDILRNLSW